MTEIFIPIEKSLNCSRPFESSQISPHNPSASALNCGVDTSNILLKEEMHSNGKGKGNSRTHASIRPLPKVIQGCSRMSSPPLTYLTTQMRNTEADLPPLPPPHFNSPDSTRPSLPSYIKPSHAKPSLPSNTIPPKNSLSTNSTGPLYLAKNRPDSSTNHINPSSIETGEEVIDIEACIDNPVLAPLGRHVNKRRSSRKQDKGHIDINVVRPTSPTTFIREQEREAHTPVTSLILRRRRLDYDQLDRYLKNLLPTLDPHTMTTLQSPLLHLTELDLSRNRLAAIPSDITSHTPYLHYLNLSHNQFTEVPMELCQLSQLQVLILSQNRIEGPFPHQVCSSLTQLKTLKLCSNQITSLPHTLSCLDQLESLSMGSVYGGNLLTSFPANCIQYMTALRELDLSHNKICHLPADIGHVNSHLRQLIVSDNKLEAIPKSIGLCKELRNLNLGRNQLTSLPTEIADLKQLDTLDLSENLLCVIPGDVADFLTKTTLLLTGNPFTRGYCDPGRNPVGDINGLGISYPSDEERYAAMLKSLSRRAILNSAATASSSGTHTPTLSSFNGTKEQQNHYTPSDSSYEMDQDEKLDYRLYYTRHNLSPRPPSRAESIGSINEYGGGAGSDNGSLYSGSFAEFHPTGTGASTPRVNVEAVLSDIDSFFDYTPPVNSIPNTVNLMTPISSGTNIAEPSIFDGTALSVPPSPTLVAMPSPLSSGSTPQLLSPTPTRGMSAIPSPSDQPYVSTPSQNFFPTLRELTARTVLHIGQPIPLEYIPEAVIDYLQPGARPCALCRKPYVKEWVSSVRVKSYLGHPAVARRVRFCSTACWKAANEQLEAEESGRTPPSVKGYLPPVTTSVNSIGKDMGCLSVEHVLEGTMTCKGGQTYWPVIIRPKRQKDPSSRTPQPASLSDSPTSSPKSITRTNVCSGGCPGEGVCEW
ncbi:hypothetical protein BGZ76_009223 [Entomortierella beljakovae]|nr:hypothetical protein BGZ76_009223 [Entomortierella beljakovae]